MRGSSSPLFLRVAVWYSRPLPLTSDVGWLLSADCVHHNKLWKILKEMGIPEHLICLLRNLYASMQVRKQQLELDMEQQTGSK